jgi:hypothetical protein
MSLKKLQNILEMNETAIRVALSRQEKTIEKICKIHSYGMNKKKCLEKYLKVKLVFEECTTPDVAPHLEQYTPFFFKGCYTGVETRNSVDDS